MSRVGRRVRGGFTLAEVLLAMGLIVVLAGGVFSFLWNLLDRREALLVAAAETDAAGTLISRIESDLLCAIAGDPAMGAGVKGTATRLRVLSRGVSLGSAGGDPGGAQLGDLQGSEYLYDAAAGTVKARRWAVVPGDTESPAERLEVVSDRVQSLRLRYFTGREWAEEFDSLEQGLPVAVEVSVWFGSPLEAADDEFGAPERPAREADRQRIIVVPDGPVAAWKEGA